MSQGDDGAPGDEGTPGDEEAPQEEEAQGDEEAEPRQYTISELAAACGTTPRAIRLYEKRGLLAPGRVGRWRIFGPRDREQLERVLRTKQLGYPLAAIKDFIDLSDLDEAHVGQLRASLAGCRARIVELELHQADLEAALAELHEREALIRERFAALGVDPDGEEKAASEPPPEPPGPAERPRTPVPRVRPGGVPRATAKAEPKPKRKPEPEPPPLPLKVTFKIFHPAYPDGLPPRDKFGNLPRLGPLPVRGAGKVAEKERDDGKREGEAAGTEEEGEGEKGGGD
jgi:DNA-binding transcriptional MerR regulator